jgi:hypothetical protein
VADLGAGYTGRRLDPTQSGTFGYEVIADQLDQPPTWVFETTGYAIIMVAFVASGYGLSTGHHFKVDLLARRFPWMAVPLAVLSGLLDRSFYCL